MKSALKQDENTMNYLSPVTLLLSELEAVLETGTPALVLVLPFMLVCTSALLSALTGISVFIWA
jgi:hypothetical protein